MNTPYENLANAIIEQAVKDYSKVLRKLSLYPHKSLTQYKCRSIEQFFRSDYFGVLTNINPETLIARLNKEVSA